MEIFWYVKKMFSSVIVSKSINSHFNVNELFRKWIKITLNFNNKLIFR